MSLGEWRGRPLILSFYPADFSPVCGDQLAIYNELLTEFGEYNAQLLGHLGRRAVVSCRVRAGAEAPLSVAQRLRAEGRGVARVRRVSRRGRNE